jgi:hypothetical protein
MAWNPDGTRLAVATGGGRVFVWDTKWTALLWTSPILPGRAHSLAFHPAEALLALACEDHRIRMVNLFEQKVVFEAVAQTPLIGFSLDGGRFGPVEKNGQVGWFQPNRSPEYIEFDAKVESERLSHARFSGDGGVLVAGHSTGLALCDPNEGKVLLALPTFRTPSFAFHPTEHFVLTGNTPGMVRFEHQASLKKMFDEHNYTVINYSRPWRALAFTPDGKALAAFNGQSNTVVLFDEKLRPAAAFGSHPHAEDIAISADARWVATGSYEGQSVRVWDASNGDLAKEVRTGPRPQSAFSRDGKWLATFGDAFGLWMCETWLPAPALPVEDEPVAWGAAAFSNDSRYLAVVANLNAVHLFDLRAFESVGILRPSGAIRIRALVFSPDDSKLAAVGGEGLAGVWHLERIRQRLEEHGLGWSD